MRISTVISSALVSSLLSGCLGQEPTPPEEPSLYTDMPRTSTVSGYIIDPEAFFAVAAGWPVDPEDPEGPPPPMLFNGIPYFEFSSITGANVSLVSGGTRTSSSLSRQGGVWQVFDVPLSGTTTYVVRAEPAAGGVELGAGVPFPSPVALPPATYVPTITLRPVVPSVPSCQFVVNTMVGDAGALSALARARTAAGTPTTVADLLDPSKTGGVVLTWIYAPSFMVDWFQFPSGDIALEASAGTVYSLDWAPPGLGGPEQSPMGFMASAGGVSPLGYYAILLPPGASGPLSVNFIDNVTTPEGEDPGPFGPRPWFVPPLAAEVEPGVVTLARVFAFPGGEEEPPPPDTDDEPAPVTPGNDFSKLCMPM